MTDRKLAAIMFTDMVGYSALQAVRETLTHNSGDVTPIQGEPRNAARAT